MNHESTTSSTVCELCTGRHLTVRCPNNTDAPPPSLWKADRRSVLPQPPLKPCGTYAAFMRHRRAGEKPCDDCRLAERIYMLPLQRAWREANRDKERERLKRKDAARAKRRAASAPHD